MGMNSYPEGLSYSLIEKAVNGDRGALDEILRIYEPYHDSLVSYEVMGKDGKLHREINEDWKVQVQMKLVDAIQTKWRELI